MEIDFLRMHMKFPIQTSKNTTNMEKGYFIICIKTTLKMHDLDLIKKTTLILCQLKHLIYDGW